MGAALGLGFIILGQQRGGLENPGGLEMRLGVGGFVPTHGAVLVPQSMSPSLDSCWFVLATLPVTGHLQQLEAWSAPALCGESA